jgi:hypothetical protein
MKKIINQKLNKLPLSFFDYFLFFVIIFQIYIFQKYSLNETFLFKVKNDESNNIFQNNFNLNYLEFKNFSYFQDFGFYIPVVVIISTILYLNYKSNIHINIKILSLFAGFYIVYSRLGIIEVFFVSYICYLTFKRYELKKLFSLYILIYFFFNFLLGRSSLFNVYSCKSDCSFQGEIIIALIVALFFYIFVGNKNILLIFSCSLMITFLLNPINNIGGYFCCGSSNAVIIENTLSVNGYQWENFGKSLESPRGGDYSTIEKVSLNKNPYDEPLIYPPASLVLTKSIFSLTKNIEYSQINLNALNFSIFLIITLLIFLICFKKILGVPIVMNLIFISSYIFLGIFINEKYTILLIVIKSILLILFFTMNKKILINENNFLLLFIPLSFPFIYGVERGNLDLILFPLLLLFIILFKDRKYFSATFVLSLAVSFKIFPIIFLLLFFRKNNIKYIFYTLFQTFLITSYSFFILGYRYEGYLDLLNNFSRPYLDLSNPINYSALTGSFTAFIKQYFSLLNLGYIYGETSNTGFYDVTTSFGIWTSIWNFPRLKILLIAGLLIFCFKYLLEFRTMASVEFLMMLSIVFIIFFDFSPAYRFSIIVIPLIFYKLILNQQMNLALLIFLLPVDFLFFPSHLTMVNTASLFYFPTLIYLFKLLSNTSTNFDKKIIFEKINNHT